MINLERVFQRFCQYDLRMKPRKRSLFKTQKISRWGVQILSESIKAVTEWPDLKSMKYVERFKGLTNYHRDFTKHYSDLAEPLLRILRNNEFQWSEEELHSFHSLKEALQLRLSWATPQPRMLSSWMQMHPILRGYGVASSPEWRRKSHWTWQLHPFKGSEEVCMTRKELLAVVRFIH
ncbi:Pol polyprotein [Plakobranchus ocellatus]|uniref:Pol polyprotein n=1 Tax=Plakobranchus ocellatus TaxID=259542 RepID=A0AAV3ZH29_9GAST|nr:Pol polyprotein [Plakobranchus ocellatus]